MSVTRPRPTIRRAGPADAAALARIGRSTFAETFGRLYPPRDLEAFLAEAHDPHRLADLLADAGAAAWLVEADGEPVGYGLAGPCDLPHPRVTPGCGEVKRLYVLKSWQGDGLGRNMLREMLEWLERLGPRPLWVGVWAENHGAQRLYSRFGFEKAGEYDFRVGGSVDREFILERSPQPFREKSQIA